MARKLSAMSDAPPTRPPSTSFLLRSALAFSGFRLPPVLDAHAIGEVGVPAVGDPVAE
jgi:hypothetical protein